jgi:N-acetyl-S-(2-succino)cysteine monooxygenase
MLAATTTHIGFAVTLSTVYHEPFHVGRTIASLDHLSRGRAAWNMVSSIGDLETRNFRTDHRPAPDERAAHAEEFLAVVTALSDSWADDAIVADPETGIFADPTRVHAADHHGRWFDVHGPLNLSRPPQGRPVLIRTGASDQFRDIVFTRHHAR